MPNFNNRVDTDDYFLPLLLLCVSLNDHRNILIEDFRIVEHNSEQLCIHFNMNNVIVQKLFRYF
jgi:hypothetical protein